jgi:hypothetical protein
MCHPSGGNNNGRQNGQCAREWHPLPTSSQSGKIRPRFDQQTVFKRERERLRDLARPLRTYDPSAEFKRANRTKNKRFINKAQASLLPDADLRIIQSKIADDFTTHVDRGITRFIQPFIQQVSAGQLREPVVLSSSLRDYLAPTYCSAVRQALRAYAADVVLSLTHRRRMNPKQVQGLMCDTNRIIERQTSARTACALIGQVSNYLRIDDCRGAAKVLKKAIGGLTHFLKKVVAEDMRWILAIYGSQDSPHETTTAHAKVADPKQFPAVTILETMEVLNRSRSSVYRYLEEGRLMPGPLSGTVTTRSVAEVLNKN